MILPTVVTPFILSLTLYLHKREQKITSIKRQKDM